MTSWVRKIKSPFKKAGTFFNQQPNNTNHKKSHQQGGGGGHELDGAMNLHGEVMACAYEDVQIMWSILDIKSKSTPNLITSSS